MPELPEVEVVRRGLAHHVVGRQITGVSVFHPRSVRSHVSGPAGFAAEVRGRRVDGIARRGKFLWFVLADDALLVHLRMSGQFRINGPADEPHPHLRIAFDLDDGRQLRFLDQRIFGEISLRLGGAGLPVPHIALDPFDAAFDLAGVARRLRTKRTAVKRALLDQGLVSGIGNIYADEALWRARLHGETAASSLSQRKAAELLRHATNVMRDALDAGGTSFDSLYVNVNGESGYFSRSLDAYGREGQPCPRCGTPIVRAHFANRSSHFCPRCQRLPRR